MKLFHYKQLLLEYATLDKTRPYSPDELSKMYGTDYKVHFDEDGELILGKVKDKSGKVIGVQSVHSTNNYFSQAIPYNPDSKFVAEGGCGSSYYGSGFYTAIDPAVISGYKKAFRFNYNFGFADVDRLFDELGRIIKNVEKAERHATIKSSASEAYISNLQNQKYYKLLTVLDFWPRENIDLFTSFEKTIQNMSANLWMKYCPEVLQNYSFFSINKWKWRHDYEIDEIKKFDSTLVYPLTSLALRLYYYFKYAPLTYVNYIKKATNIIIESQHDNFRKQVIINNFSISEILDEKTLNRVISFFAYEILLEELRAADKSPIKEMLQKSFDIVIPDRPATKEPSFWQKGLNKAGLRKGRQGDYNRLLMIFNLIKSSTSFKDCTPNTLLSILQGTEYILNNKKQATDNVAELYNSIPNKIERVVKGSIVDDYLAKQLRKFFSLLLKYGKAIAPEIANSLFKNIKTKHYDNPDYIMAYLAFTIPPEDPDFNIDDLFDFYDRHIEGASQSIWSYILSINFKKSAFAEFSKQFNLDDVIIDNAMFEDKDEILKLSSEFNKVNFYKKILTIIPEVLKTSYPKVKRIIKNTITQEFTNLNEKLKSKKSPVGGLTYVYFSKIFVKPGDVLPLHLPVLTNENFLDLKKIFGKEDITREKCSKLLPKLHPCIRNMLTAETDTGREFFTWLLQHNGTLYDFNSRTGFLTGMDIHNLLGDFSKGISVEQAFNEAFFKEGSAKAKAEELTMNKIADILVKCGINATEQEQHLDADDLEPNYIILNKDITRIVAKLRVDENVDINHPEFHKSEFIKQLDNVYKVIPTTQEREAKTIKLWKDTLNNIVKNICDKTGVKKENIEKIINSIPINNDNIDVRNYNIIDDSFYEAAMKNCTGIVSNLVEKLARYLDTAFHVIGSDGEQSKINSDIIKSTVVALLVSNLVIFKNNYLFESYNRPITVGQLLNEYRFYL